MTQNEVDVVNEIENGLFHEYTWLFSRKNHEYVKMVKIVENAIDKYSQKLQNQKAIECLKEIKAYIEKNESPSFEQSLDGYWFISSKKLFEYINTKIKAFEGEKEWNIIYLQDL